VPKREIFYRSDFPDFYTIKSLRVGDFGVKIKNFLKIFRGSFRGASIFKDVFFKVLAKKFFSMALLRPLVTVKINFLKFFIF
jgi:hypothetical protein